MSVRSGSLGRAIGTVAPRPVVNAARVLLIHGLLLAGLQIASIVSFVFEPSEELLLTTIVVFLPGAAIFLIAWSGVRRRSKWGFGIALIIHASLAGLCGFVGGAALTDPIWDDPVPLTIAFTLLATAIANGAGLYWITRPIAREWFLGPP